MNSSNKLKLSKILHHYLLYIWQEFVVLNLIVCDHFLCFNDFVCILFVFFTRFSSHPQNVNNADYFLHERKIHKQQSKGTGKNTINTKINTNKISQTNWAKELECLYSNQTIGSLRPKHSLSTPIPPLIEKTTASQSMPLPKRKQPSVSTSLVAKNSDSNGSSNGSMLTSSKNQGASSCYSNIIMANVPPSIPTLGKMNGNVNSTLPPLPPLNNDNNSSNVSPNFGQVQIATRINKQHINQFYRHLAELETRNELEVLLSTARCIYDLNSKTKPFKNSYSLPWHTGLSLNDHKRNVIAVFKRVVESRRNSWVELMAMTCASLAAARRDLEQLVTCIPKQQLVNAVVKQVISGSGESKRVLITDLNFYLAMSQTKENVK